MDNVFFSIIIPAYNRADLLPKTLKSLITQTFKGYEIIIVDDGSTDNTAAVMEEFIGDSIRYFRKDNQERAAARNFGTQQAKGKYITFLDSDDVLYTQCLQHAYESIQKFDNPPFLHLGYEVVDEKAHSLAKVDSLKSDDISIFIKGNPLSCIGVFLREDITRKYFFNEDRALSGSEDWALWIRIAANDGLKTDNRISAALINHTSRSVHRQEEKSLLMRKELAIHYAFEDEKVKLIFSPHLAAITAYWDSYIALHLVLSGNNKRALYYWYLSLSRYPIALFERRSLAIVKYLIINLISLSSSKK